VEDRQGDSLSAAILEDVIGTCREHDTGTSICGEALSTPNSSSVS
jgi:phosphoenolpyruvate synthase/pyruvate phosphate dikinase